MSDKIDTPWGTRVNENIPNNEKYFFGSWFHYMLALVASIP